MNEIESILLKLGLDLKNENSLFWRAKPIYRESSNPTSLRISKKSGSFVDFAANVKGNIYDLIKLCLGLSSVEDAKKWAKKEFGSINFESKKPKMEVLKTILPKYYENLMPNYSFYNERGISKETLENFECGVSFSSKQNNRFVFVIRNEDGDVVGISGRDLIGGRTKWKNLGYKQKWVFPLNSLKYIEETKEVFLVESIGDMLALYEIDVKNVIVTFGVDISSKLINLLSTMNLERVFISTNNDADKKKNWGDLAAESIKKKMSKFIEESKLVIALPPENDWGTILDKNLRKEYVEKIRNNK